MLSFLGRKESAPANTPERKEQTQGNLSLRLLFLEKVVGQKFYVFYIIYIANNPFSRIYSLNALETLVCEALFGWLDAPALLVSTTRR